MDIASAFICNIFTYFFMFYKTLKTPVLGVEVEELSGNLITSRSLSCILDYLQLNN